MNLLLRLLYQYFLFGSTMFFAASAVGDVGAEGGDDAGGPDGSVVGDSAGADVDSGHPDSDDADLSAEGEIAESAKPQTPTEEPEVSEFKGFASTRLKALIKQAPELAKVFQEKPQIQNEIEARFRREAAYRETFPTVAEARQMRERFPNGLADVQALEEDVKEVEQLDKLFYTKDPEGNYSGHAQVLDNMFRDDREATLSFLRTVPKEWARLDRESYNDVNGQIVGATLAGRGVFDFLSDQIEAAKAAKQDGIAGGLTKLLNVLEGYTKGKPQPTEADQRLAADRQKFQRETQERAKQDGQRFHNTFSSESKKLQLDIIGKHPAVARLVKANIPEAKRAEIVSKIRDEMEKFLGKSASFMRKLKPLHASGNLQEAISLQRAAWSNPALLNPMIRKVFRVETPALVTQNRDSVRRRTPPTRTPAQPGVRKSTPTGPHQIGKEWFKGDGTKFTTAEVLAGRHLQA
jgi:hypothetical protein